MVILNKLHLQESGFVKKSQTTRKNQNQQKNRF